MVTENMKLSVVMPVYNEAFTVAQSITRVMANELVGQLIVVDDGSEDRSLEIVQQMARLDARITICRHPVNRGKGAALRTGFNNVTREAVVIQDADLEYDPKDYDSLLFPIANNSADVVYGSRYINRDAAASQSFAYRVANFGITYLSNLATGLALTDVETCYKCFRREIIEAMVLTENRFGIEIELTAQVAAMGYYVEEVPISYTGRTKPQGKKIGLKDGLEALFCIVRHWKRTVRTKKRLPLENVRKTIT
jgi:glycosyltransferase involved in cell wall biosynthesis